MEKSKFKIIIKTQFLKMMRKGEWKSFIDSVIEEGRRVVNTKKINGYTLLSCATEYGDKEIVEYLIRNGAESNFTNFNGSIPLHVAAKHNHKDLLEFFINLSVSVDSRDYMNRTPLHYVTEKFYKDIKEHSLIESDDDEYYYTTSTDVVCSVEKEHMELASYLLCHGADIDATDNEGNVPLLLAAMHSCTGVVEMLIRRGANIKCCDEYKWTVLHYASCLGWLSVVQCLVEIGGDLNVETIRGDTPLLWAAANSHKKVVELLVKSGANVSCRGMLKTTALHYASQEGWLKVVKLLVENKADINAKDCSGATPLMLAVKHENWNIFDFLVKSGAHLVGSEGKTTILHYACETKYEDLVQSLVDWGYDIDAQTLEGDTPLLIAARHSSKGILDILLKSGANLHISNPNSYSLLHHACKNNWIDVVQLLVNAGLDINTKNPDGSTPLMVSASNRDLRIFEYLLEVGADMEVRKSSKYDYGDFAVLHYACGDEGSFAMVSSLLSKGADVNVKTSKGWTPLYVAVRCKKLEIVLYLLDAEADVNVQLFDGSTPLYLAVNMKHLEIATHLLKAGANCNEDNGFETPFQCYVNNRYDVLKLPIFIESGAYITQDTYCTLIGDTDFKEDLLKNVGFCTQAILNKFNNLDLHEIYQVPFAVRNLPPIERMKIGGKRYVAQSIEESVIREIDTNGYCNIAAIQPIVLNLLSAKAFVKHIKDRNY